MKTFKSEHAELIDWRFERKKESDKLPYNDGEGRGPSTQCIQEQKDFAEYRRRVAVLEEKYGKT